VYEHDTIAAIATPPGHGGVAILRISGASAESTAQTIFLPTQPWEQLHSHHLYLGRIVDPRTGSSLDQAMLALMRAPHSYTGENVAEIHCHGGSFLAQRILEAVLNQGARLALPGEFTKRAFLNGRLDLSQAEAVQDLIQAKSEEGVQLAWNQLSGRLSEQCETIRERLIRLTAHVEAFLDFPEDDIPERTQQEFTHDLSSLISTISHLHATFAQGKVYRDGVRTVIVGKPNVGKSSLLNALAGTERAIVTAQPGTTRDVLEETILINDIPLVVWDTAGLHIATDEVERIGVERARAGIQQAELVIAVFDAARLFDEEDRDVCESVSGKMILPVLNKVDLPHKNSAAEVAACLGTELAVHVSAKNGTGLDGMARRISELILGTEQILPKEGQGAVVTRVRHRDALIKAEHCLTNALESMQTAWPLDLIAVDLRAGLDHIGEITGHVNNEEILDHIFREFCIGK
jgi:tRNA modification GTPase